MKTLVTGGSGFIGTRLVGRLLQGGHEVTIFDKVLSTEFEKLCVEGDVRDKQALTEAMKGTEAVFHLAAEHRDDVSPPSLYADTNVEGTKNVALAAQAVKCEKIVFTSSVAVYPLNSPNPTEISSTAPFNEYGRTKLKAEGVLKRWAEADPGRTLVVIRPCVVFGERNRGNVYNLLNQLQRGRFLVVGSGENKKSMAYVGNLVEFMVSSLSYPRGSYVFNYADKPDITTDELVAVASRYFGLNPLLKNIKIPYAVGMLFGYVFDFIARLTGRTYPISSIRVKKFASDTTVSSETLMASGFKPPFSLEEALLKTLSAEFPKRDPRSSSSAPYFSAESSTSDV